jgi:hypothetical protein
MLKPSNLACQNYDIASPFLLKLVCQNEFYSGAAAQDVMLDPRRANSPSTSASTVENAKQSDLGHIAKFFSLIEMNHRSDELN